MGPLFTCLRLASRAEIMSLQQGRENKDPTELERANGQIHGKVSI